MKTFIFYGAGDDLVQVAGAERHEHDVTGHQAATFTLTLSDGRGARVLVRYESNGCWSTGMVPLDEDIEVPAPWHFAVTRATVDGEAPQYTAVLFANVDDDTTLAYEAEG